MNNGIHHFLSLCKILNSFCAYFCTTWISLKSSFRFTYVNSAGRSLVILALHDCSFWAFFFSSIWVGTRYVHTFFKFMFCTQDFLTNFFSPKKNYFCQKLPYLPTKCPLRKLWKLYVRVNLSSFSPPLTIRKKKNLVMSSGIHLAWYPHSVFAQI